MARDIHFGVTIPQIKRTWEEAKSASIEFEAMGYDCLWSSETQHDVARRQQPVQQQVVERRNQPAFGEIA